MRRSNFAAAVLAGLAGMGNLFPVQMDIAGPYVGPGRPKRSAYVPHQNEREKARRRRQMAAGKLNCTIIA